MEAEKIVALLEDPSGRPEDLRLWGLQNLQRAQVNLQRIARYGVTLDLLVSLTQQLSEWLPKASDPDMALNNLERFIGAARSPLALGALLDRDRTALPILLRIFSTSQHLSDLLVREPEAYDLLRLTEGQPVSRQLLVDDITSELESLQDERAAMAALRRFKHRETLRIAYGDLVGNQRIDVITRQISYVADAICHAAVSFARRRLEQRRGMPRGNSGVAAQYCVLALGKLGGSELNYSSDIDLVMFYDVDGMTDGERAVANREFFERLTQDFVRLLTEPTELGAAYRVDLRLRPHGRTGPLVNSRDGVLQYYDLQGRTWERQAFVKARPIAGNLQLGTQLLQKLQPWIYRKYLSRNDINGICALKRRIENRAVSEGGNERNVKEGRGGIRDIEFTIQFLQLLNGGDLPAIHTGNTLEAIAQLAEAGCLTLQERTLLEDSYVFLRRVEHRLQILFDLQTHELPESETELRKLALRLDFADRPDQSAVEQFRASYAEKTELNRKILNFLLHDAFAENLENAPESDLVLDPEPAREQISEVLGRFAFKDQDKTFRSLKALSTERIPFLSQRRCRHFLASILPKLLPAVAGTPDPEFTLVNLEQVSDSIGGKGLLWELFSYNPPSMDLYVRLCAACPYLAGILTSNPGMVDELLDSLLLDRLPSFAWLQQTLTELCRGAEDVEPILHAFKNAQHLRVGVRDILGKEDVVRTHAALSDVAEVLLTQAIDLEYRELAQRHGIPQCDSNGGERRPCEFVVLGMGKLGGREPNYHSDLDVIFVYEEDGFTEHRNPQRVTSNQHFFTQLGVKLMMRMNHVGPYGRLYETDARLRPTGRSGTLVVPLSEFQKYFASGQGQLWERQALCKARPISGSPRAAQRAMKVVRQAIFGPPWECQQAEEIVAMRNRLQMTASDANLKRGYGGTVDVEFTVQMLQLRYGEGCPEIMQPGTLTAIDALQANEILPQADAKFLQDSYRLLRSVEARLRLLNTTARHDLPTDPGELAKLAYILRVDDVKGLLKSIAWFRAGNRRIFQAVAARLNRE